MYQRTLQKIFEVVSIISRYHVFLVHTRAVRDDWQDAARAPGAGSARHELGPVLPILPSRETGREPGTQLRAGL